MKYTQNIFLSSTFQDMHAERDLLHNVVIPELLSRFSKYHLRLDLIDLRWGIDTADDASEQETTNKILRVCFDEIERSRPFFIGFIGERYGWIPKTEDIESAVLGYGLEYDPDNACSITELEMRYALQQFTDDEYCFFFIRNGLSPEDIEDDSLRKVYFPEDPALTERCDRLKDHLRSHYGDRTFDYHCRWDSRTGQVSGLEELEELLINQLSHIIRTQQRSRAEQSVGIFSQEQALQQTVAQQLCRHVYGRESQLEHLLQFLRDPDSNRRELAVVAPSGLGKSSLLAKLYQSLAGENTVVIPFFAGSSELTRDFRFLPRYCCHFLQPAEDSSLLQMDYPSLKKQLLAALVDVAEEKQVVILVDALDQFADSKELRQLDWLHDQLIPNGVKVIYSCLPGRENVFHKRNTEIFRLDVLTPEAVTQAAAGIALSMHKELTGEALSLLADKQDSMGNRVCCVPIYLVSLMELLCFFDSDDFARIAATQESRRISAAAAIRQYVADTIRSVGCGIDDIIQELTEKSIRQLGRKYDIISALLVSSPNGITEQELYGITAARETPITPADFSIYRRMFRMHLQQRERGCWSFSHAIIHDAICRQIQLTSHRVLWEQAAAWYSALPADDSRRCAGIVRFMGKCQNYAGIAAACGTSIDVSGADALYELAETLVPADFSPHPLLAAFDAPGRLTLCRSLLEHMDSLGTENEVLLDLCCNCIAALQQDDLTCVDRVVLLSDFYSFGGLLLLHENDPRARSFFELSLNVLLHTNGVDPEAAPRQAMEISRIFSARQDRMVAEQYANAAWQQARRCCPQAGELLAQANYELGSCILANPLSLDRPRAGYCLKQALGLAQSIGVKDLAARVAIAFLKSTILPQTSRQTDLASGILRNICPGEVSPRTLVELQLYRAEQHKNNASKEVLDCCRSAYEAAIDGLARDNSNDTMELYEQAAEQYGYSLMLHKDLLAVEILVNADRICRKLNAVTNDARWNDRRISIQADLAAFCRALALPLPDICSAVQPVKPVSDNREVLQQKNIYRNTAGRIGIGVCVAYAVFLAVSISLEIQQLGVVMDPPMYIAAVILELLEVIINILLVVTMNYLALMIRNPDKETGDHRLNRRLLTRNIVLNGILIALCCGAIAIYSTGNDTPYYYDRFYGAIANTQVLFYVFSAGFTWFIAYVVSGLIERAESSGLRQSARFIYRHREILRAHIQMCLFSGVGILFFLPCIGVPTMNHHFVYLSPWRTQMPDYIPFCWIPLAIQGCFSLLELRLRKRQCGSAKVIRLAPAKKQQNPAALLALVTALGMSAAVIALTIFFMESVAKQYQYASYGYSVSDGLYYKYQDEGDGISVFDYRSDTDGEYVRVPAELDGNRVVSISSGAFDYTNITGISLPSGITEIPENAFQGCCWLQEVQLPDTLRTIGESAFENCASLTVIHLPASLERIESNAFSGCFMLESVSVPEQADPVIEADAFLDTGLEFAPQTLTQGYYAVANQIVCGNKHHHGPLVIAEGITGISDGAFSNSVGITELYLPDSLTSIGSDAFSGCNSLYYVSFGAGIASIEGDAFDACENLMFIDDRSSLNIRENNFGGLLNSTPYVADPRTEGSALPERTDDGFLFRYDQARNSFYLLSTDESQRTITIPVDYQGNLFFPEIVFTPYSDCVSIIVPELYHDSWYGYGGVRAGEPETFPLAEILTDGKPSTVITDDRGLIYCRDTASNVIWILGHTGQTSELIIDFPTDTTVMIHPYAFRADPTITAVTLVGNISVPDNAFESCCNLSSFSAEGILTLGERAFYNCRALKSATLTAEIHTLPNELFLNCISLKEFTVPATVSAVGNGCFHNCINLEHITATNVNTVGEKCFLNCFRLAGISLGAALEHIHADAFLYCFSMEQVCYGGTVSQWCRIDFSDKSSSPFYDSFGAKLFTDGVPVTAAEFDDTVEQINAYSFFGYASLETVSFSENIRQIGAYAFANCHGLRELTLPRMLTELDTAVFMDCTQLEKIDLSSVVILGDSAFNGCTMLKTVIGFDRLQHIGFKTFSHCEALLKLDFGQDLHTIETYAFQYCTGLRSVTLPDSLESAGDNLFTGCTNLTRLELPEMWRSSIFRILGNCIPEEIIYR